MTLRSRGWWLLLLPAAALGLAACADAPATGDAVVEMLDNTFAPSEIHVPVGGTVTFVGAGRNPHNAVAADGSWSTEDSFGSLNQLEGDAATVSFDQPGEYAFFCTFHGTAYGSGMAGKVYFVDPSSGKKLYESSTGHEYGVTDMLFHPDGKHILSSGRDTVVRVWQVADGKQVKELGKPRGGQFKDWVHAVSLSPDGRWLAAGDMAGQVQVWSLA